MIERHDFEDGKYTIINDNGILTCLRHGEPWDRDLTGDKLIGAMFAEVTRIKADGSRWAYIRKHWKGVKFTFNKDAANLMRTAVITISSTVDNGPTECPLDREVDAAIKGERL